MSTYPWPRVGARLGTRARVVIFDSYPNAYGGAQHVDHFLARELPGRGWPVLTIVPGPGRFVERLRRDGLAVEVVPAARPLSRFGGSTKGRRLAVAVVTLPWYWLRLTRRLREVRPSVAHIADLRGMVLAGVPARLAGARVVWHVHATVGSPGLNRLAACCAHVIAVPSRATARQVGGRWPHKRIEVVSNAIGEEARRSSPVDLVREPVLVTLGRLHPQKGLDVLLRAALLLQPRHAGLRVLIAGDEDLGGPRERDRLLALIDRTALAGRVEFLGFCERTAEIIARGRVYVQPSRQETQGLAILEAMAVGVPVVATDVGGVSEGVDDGVNGLLVAPDDPAAMAAAIDRLLTDPAIAERLRRAAFETVRGFKYSPEGALASTIALYERIV